VSIKGRIRKLEEERRNGPDPLCEECASVIIYEEIQPDGSVHYPDKQPCPICGSHGSEGRIGRIVVDMHESDGERTPGDVYQVVPCDE
jgi:hypothetical protein